MKNDKLKIKLFNLYYILNNQDKFFNKNLFLGKTKNAFNFLNVVSFNSNFKLKFNIMGLIRVRDVKLYIFFIYI